MFTIPFEQLQLHSIDVLGWQLSSTQFKIHCVECFIFIRNHNLHIKLWLYWQGQDTSGKQKIWLLFFTNCWDHCNTVLMLFTTLYYPGVLSEFKIQMVFYELSKRQQKHFLLLVPLFLDLYLFSILPKSHAKMKKLSELILIALVDCWFNLLFPRL